jgi:hypothetical protein
MTEATGGRRLYNCYGRRKMWKHCREDYIIVMGAERCGNIVEKII